MNKHLGMYLSACLSPLHVTWIPSFSSPFAFTQQRWWGNCFIFNRHSSRHAPVFFYNRSLPLMIMIITIYFINSFIWCKNISTRNHYAVLCPCFWHSVIRIVIDKDCRVNPQLSPRLDSQTDALIHFSFLFGSVLTHIHIVSELHRTRQEQEKTISENQDCSQVTRARVQVTEKINQSSQSLVSSPLKVSVSNFRFLKALMNVVNTEFRIENAAVWLQIIGWVNLDWLCWTMCRKHTQGTNVGTCWSKFYNVTVQ